MKYSWGSGAIGNLSDDKNLRLNSGEKNSWIYTHTLENYVAIKMNNSYMQKTESWKHEVKQKKQGRRGKIPI